jgi:signal transduction histidine kinase
MTEPEAVSAPPSELAETQQKLRVEQRKVEAMLQLGRVLGATLDLDRMLVVLLGKVTELLDAERATIYLVSDNGSLQSKIFEGGTVATIRLRSGEGIAGWVAQSGATVNIPDAYADPRFNQAVDKASGFRTRSILCMPMPDHKGRTLGVVQVLNKRLGPFTADDEALLATVAAHSGIAIENGKLYLSVVGKNAALLRTQAELKQRIADLDLLFEIEKEASAALDVDELLSRLLSRAIQIVGAEAGSVLLRERGGELFFRTAHGRNAAALQKLKLPPGEGIVGWVALHRMPLIVNDPVHDARHDLSIAEQIGVPARSILAVPLVAPRGGDTEEGSLGAIELLNKPAGEHFDDDDLKLLTLIAGQASRAITIARSRAERLQSERLASIGQSLSSMMHDLKTPMTIVSGYAQLMAQSDDAKTRAEYADMVLKQFDLMAAMTREVLQFARGESQLLVRKVYVQTWLNEVQEQLERELAGKKVELVIDARYQGLAYFDEKKMFRLISNLARNAAQAMEGGGRFTMTVDVDGPELVMSFADTGQGIPEAMQGRVFEAFATSGKRDGTGLGLAIVKKIVDEHQGRVSYQSQPGAGTTFRVGLPLQRTS